MDFPGSIGVYTKQLETLKAIVRNIQLPTFFFVNIEHIRNRNVDPKWMVSLEDQRRLQAAIHAADAAGFTSSEAQRLGSPGEVVLTGGRNDMN